MLSNPNEPIYNIGAASRLTGIPVETLHAWERRYGFPHPAGRTRGGHRLYSEEDISRLRLARERMQQGLSAHQAVLAAFQPGGEPLSQPVPANPGRIAPAEAGSTDILRARLNADLLRGDLEGAGQALGEMLALYTPEELALDFIGPALVEIGEAWEQGRLSVAGEHLASGYLRQRLLLWMASAPPPRRQGSILLACAPGERHEGGLLMLGVLLRRRGFPVAYLGQDTPLADLAAYIEQARPAAVVLAATGEEAARALLDWPQVITQRDGRPIIAFGGRAFVSRPELQGQMPGVYLGDTLEEGVVQLEGLMAPFGSAKYARRHGER